MNLYLENLTFDSFLFVFHNGFLKDISKREERIIYFIDASRIGIICGQLFRMMLGVEFQQLKFKMMDIKDENGELVRLRIPRKDLFEIQKKIIHSIEFRKLHHPSWKHSRLDKFLKKGIIDGDTTDNLSCSRILYLINVIHWNNKNKIIHECQLMVKNRAWFNIYKEYASNFDIKLIAYNDILKFDPKNRIKQLIKKSPYLYCSIRNLKNKIYNSKIKPTQSKNPKLFLEGRGDVNIKNNGHHSDFFWQMNSDFDANNLLYNAKTDEEYLLLRNKKICVSGGSVNYVKRNCKIHFCSTSRDFREEHEVIQKQLTTYNSTINFWYSFLKQYNVKVWLTWYKYDNLHMAVADAITEYGGISAIWQMAFDGFPAKECEINADIIFSHSLFSHEIDKKLGSKFTNNIITGYPKDYAGKKLKEEATQLRHKLLSRGVKKIVFSIDENSRSDSRWQTGHELQRENYSFILEKVLETPWLGVIFKPKTAKTLRRRLGTVNELLNEAIKSGRCLLFEESGHYTTSTPPILAGLASDVCIHSHLSAGTAALECTLEGKPTLLIDREGCPESKLYELPKNKVIFKNWEDTIQALMEHLQTPNGIPGFGDWTPIIDDFDPFRDGKAAQRMGNYLNWLIQGFEQGQDKDVIMSDAAERYAKEWGNDKVL